MSTEERGAAQPAPSVRTGPSLVYGILPHQGLAVLYRGPNGTVYGSDNEWVAAWDKAIEEWWEADEKDRAELEESDEPSGFGWPPASFADREYSSAAARLGEQREVIGPGGDVGLGDMAYLIDTYAEKYLIDRARGLGIGIVHDDDLIAAEATRVFADCPCVTDPSPAGGDLDFSRVYNMVSSVSRGGRILPTRGGWALVVCPFEIDAGESRAWVNTWIFPLHDAQEIFDTFSTDDYMVNPIEADLDEICAAMRATDAQELRDLADEVEALAD